MIRVGFLLNHDAAHQVMHSVPAAFELARRRPDIHVSIISTTRVEADAVAGVAANYPGVPCELQTVAPPAAARVFDRLTGHALLAKRFGVLWRHRKLFQSFDVLIVPDKTSLLLKRWLGESCPLMIYTFHGAGDRAGGFRGTAGFDYYLLPGRNYETRLVAAGHVHPERYRVVGYTKLDYFHRGPRPRLFDNDRPTALYTPHFDPQYSSWYGWGASVLEYFAAHPDWNLIFAPHVLLFRRRWHISNESGRPRRTPPIPAGIANAPNILVDKGSTASVDMTYTRAADVYMGDVSSQVYEFLYQPRPCIFLNRGAIQWRDNVNFRFWNLGDVLTSLDELPAALERARTEPQRYRARQQEAVAEAFDMRDTPSAVRAADAIADFIERKKLRGAP
ncbi:MAG: CDP-glycerol glycerophosphotransferase family protein [Xanthomonadales bacterium]|nr:CDP-glycerol glycerophosphotransferase family protein [Xanthomonadales bacterium]